MKWEKVEIGQVCDVGRGASPRPKDNPQYFAGGTIPWIKIADATASGKYIYTTKEFVNDYGASFSRRLEPGALIIATSGVSLGQIKLLGVEGCIHDGWLYVNNFRGVDKEFLYYHLLTMQDEFLSRAYGAAIQNINTSILRESKINLPPLPTQRKIASILSAYDDLIENNRKRIRLLEEQAFLRYKMIVREELLISGCVGDLAEVKSGFAFKSKDWAENGFPVIKIKNIDNNDIDLTDCSFIPENIAETATKFRLNAGDLLIAMTGATVGKIGMMPKTNSQFYLNQRVGIFKPKVEGAEFFLFCFFNEVSAKGAVENLASGAAQPNISGSQIESIKLFYPSHETICQFGISIRKQFELIWNLKEQTALLREARDILLPRLMSGEIEV